MIYVSSTYTSKNKKNLEDSYEEPTVKNISISKTPASGKFPVDEENNGVTSSKINLFKQIFQRIGIFFMESLTESQLNNFLIKSKLNCLIINEREYSSGFAIIGEIISNESLRHILWGCFDFVICVIFLNFPMMVNSHVEFVELVYQVNIICI